MFLNKFRNVYYVQIAKLLYVVFSPNAGSPREIQTDLINTLERSNINMELRA